MRADCGPEMTRIDLSGDWELRLAPDEAAAPAGPPASYGGRALLPGALSSQGFGEEPGVETEWTGDVFDRSWYEDEAYAPYRKSGSVKLPFWLQPDRRYVGAAWFRKRVHIPAEFVGKRLSLFLERPHWTTRLWLDGRYIGSNDSLSVPHEYDLGLVDRPGERLIELLVDNRMLVNVGPNSHSVSDHTQGNWNGIAGSLALVAASPVWIDRIDAFPSAKRRSALLRLRLGNATGQSARAELRFGRELSPGLEALPLELPPGMSEECVEYRLGPEAALWDEFSPALHEVSAEIAVRSMTGSTMRDTRTVRFGLRDLTTEGTRIRVNGRPVFLRGTLECCAFPLTGYPPTDRGSWQRLMGRVKEHGLNHIRFHSWCPPDAAFEVADELGLYLQIECSTWANQGASVGEDGRFDAWLYREAERIVERHGNHPSFAMMAYGNEPAGRTEDFLGLWVSSWRQRDARRLYTSGSGWPSIDENDYHVTPTPRIQAWGQGLGSRINALPPETASDYREFIGSARRPVVSHEIGQWCAFPNFDEIAKYAGPLKAKNFEIFRDFLARRGMAGRSRDFFMASGKLQVACYKEEIESALRTPGFAGFQLLGLSDFPGQGTALVGVLDAFWDPKDYVSSSEFREFCGPTVPLARMERRYWKLSESFRAELELAHFGASRAEGAPASWRIADEAGKTLAAGGLAAPRIETGCLSQLGAVEQSLAAFEPGKRYELEVSVGEPGRGEGRFGGRNRWDFWTFADRLGTALPEGVRECSRPDEALSILAQGGEVLLSLPPGEVATEVALGFSSVFWNTAWTNGQAPHTLGLVCDPAHPALARFPTRSYSDWLWWEIVHGASAMVLDALPAGIEPIIQPIDTWFRSHKLGLLFEARMGSGRLLVSSMDLSSDLDRRLVARQLRHSLLAYMGSEAFRPKAEIDERSLRGLLK